jgi:hypothetical protein
MDPDEGGREQLGWRLAGQVGARIVPCLHPWQHSDQFGVKSPGGYLCETGILLLALSHYIGDPDVIDHCDLV